MEISMLPKEARFVLTGKNMSPEVLRGIAEELIKYLPKGRIVEEGERPLSRATKASTNESDWVQMLVGTGRAGWVNDPEGAGAVLVEARTGILLLDQAGSAIQGPTVSEKATPKLEESTSLADLEPHEGRREQLYLDTGGKFTIGVGHFLAGLDEAAGIAFVKDGRAATPAEVAADFADVAASKEFTKAETERRPKIEDAEIRRLFKADFENALEICRNKFHSLDIYPFDAKRALLDLAFNLSLSKLNAFKNLSDAIGRRDWRTAAVESHRKSKKSKKPGDPATNLIQESRNEWTRDRFLDAAAVTPFFIATGRPGKPISALRDS
jgi:GH24 family phage-related lysozyme (muramidase)